MNNLSSYTDGQFEIEQMVKDCYEDLCKTIENAMANGHAIRGINYANDANVLARFCDWDLWGYVWPDRGAEGNLFVDGHPFSGKTGDSPKWEILCQIDDADEVGKVEYRCDLFGEGPNKGIVKYSFVSGVIDTPSWWDDIFD